MDVYATLGVSNAEATAKFYDAVLATIADPGTCLSLRVPARRSFSLDDWVANGSICSAGSSDVDANGSGLDSGLLVAVLWADMMRAE